ncbi:hypothetical protein TH63_08540 [Rufibacter radiotolerans]|uniref:Uncharacterized protein n=1 Tax=Rufibacter radiotolerans TaxID=1379910 RepID=A0A0H4VK07_9BACT|nr:hypothetical protein [Rufibacter radiotolerans]AKQ45688.1 hypothetical protein TH63_08540 [Rufibacter radiotolerans]
MIRLIKKGGWLALWLFPLVTWAQLPSIKMEGYFLQDSVQLGQSVKYILLSRQAVQAEVVFPDSTFSFAPFELVRKEFFPTRTVRGISTDSTVYTLRTFHLKPVQHLQLHARLFFREDTLQLNTLPDSVVLIQNVKVPPDDLPLMTNTQLEHVADKFNYLYWGLGLLAGAIFIGGIWGLFGNGILLRYNLYVLRKDQSQFQYRFQTSKDRFRRMKTLDHLERAITLWKNYLTKLEDEEISSFTTKEITTYYEEDERVGNSLKICDRAIYGNIISDDETEVADALTKLAEFAALRYVLIRDSLRHVANSR